MTETFAPHSTECPRQQRPNALRVDLGAIRDNVALVRSIVGSETKIFAAVKANGYGFGLPAVADAMLAGGADAFALADPRDAGRLREAGIRAPILLYGGILPGRDIAQLVTELDLTCTIGDLGSATAWSGVAARTIKAFLKLDVGLERVGCAAEAAAEFGRRVSDLPNVAIEGVYTHLHGNDAPGYLAWQLDRFERALDELATVGVEPPIRLAESSVSLGRERRSRLNAVDPGHLLYGLIPTGRTDVPTGLQRAFVALETRVLQVKSVERPAFPTVAPVPLRDGLRIAVIPLGRADGLRSLHGPEVLVHGQRAPIVGPLSLEHARIDVTHISRCDVGDEVVIIGKQGADEISADEVAARNGLPLVDLPLEVRSSIPRLYGGYPAS